jgi:hypothetical protein
MIFHVGVVEDNSSDPLKLGRVRARIFGLHTDDRTALPTADLPWSIPLAPSVGNISEVSSFTVPENGSWIVIGFLDQHQQQPFYIGTLPRDEGSELPDFTKGFSDPNSVYPTAANKGRTSYSKEATGEVSDSHTQKDSQKIASKSVGSSSIAEPGPSDGTVYPNNTVDKTSSGHVIEFDDTPTKERIHVYHKGGSFLELLANNDTHLRSNATHYCIASVGINHLANTGNLNQYAGGGWNVKIVGTARIDIAVLDINSTGAITIDGTTIDITGSGAINITSSSTAKVEGTSVVIKGTTTTLTVA